MVKKHTHTHTQLGWSRFKFRGFCWINLATYFNFFVLNFFFSLFFSGLISLCFFENSKSRLMGLSANSVTLCYSYYFYTTQKNIVINYILTKFIFQLALITDVNLTKIYQSGNNVVKSRICCICLKITMNSLVVTSF